MNTCLFCKIVKNEIPSKKIYEDDFVYGFKDINPRTDLHVLFVHKTHTDDIIHMLDVDPQQIIQVMQSIKNFVQEKKINGFRLINNKGVEGGQTIFHTHIHLLSGHELPWS